MIIKNNSGDIKIDARFDIDNNLIIYIFDEENQIWHHLYKLNITKKSIKNNQDFRSIDLFEVIKND